VAVCDVKVRVNLHPYICILCLCAFSLVSTSLFPLFVRFLLSDLRVSVNGGASPGHYSRRARAGALCCALFRICICISVQASCDKTLYCAFSRVLLLGHVDKQPFYFMLLLSAFLTVDTHPHIIHHPPTPPLLHYNTPLYTNTDPRHRRVGPRARGGHQRRQLRPLCANDAHFHRGLRSRGGRRGTEVAALWRYVCSVACIDCVLGCAVVCV